MLRHFSVSPKLTKLQNISSKLSNSVKSHDIVAIRLFCQRKFQSFFHDSNPPIVYCHVKKVLKNGTWSEKIAPTKWKCGFRCDSSYRTTDAGPGMLSCYFWHKLNHLLRNFQQKYLYGWNWDKSKMDSLTFLVESYFCMACQMTFIWKNNLHYFRNIGGQICFSLILWYKYRFFFTNH